ncbi:MAG: hypothetical protein AAB575_02595 [Patescibacteria group bacterium]
MSGKKKNVPVKEKPVKKEKLVNVAYGRGDTNFSELVGKTLAEAKEFLVSGNCNYPTNIVVSLPNKPRAKPDYKLKAGDELYCEDPEPVNVYFEKKTRSSVDFVGQTVGAVCEALRKKWKSLPKAPGIKVNDEEAKTDHVLESGDELRLSHPAVKVTCGSNGDDHTDLIGKSVAYARKMLSEKYNIKKSMNALVNDDDVDDEKSRILEQGDELEFSEEDGKKG